jgi:hypothetical protein
MWSRRTSVILFFIVAGKMDAALLSAATMLLALLC